MLRADKQRKMKIAGFSNDGRLLVSSIFAMASLVHVTIERHVQITWNEPATYMSLVEHKCGCALIACFAWMFLEMFGVLADDSPKSSGGSGFRGRPAFARVMR